MVTLLQRPLMIPMPACLAVEVEYSIKVKSIQPTMRAMMMTSLNRLI